MDATPKRGLRFGNQEGAQQSKTAVEPRRKNNPECCPKSKHGFENALQLLRHLAAVLLALLPFQHPEALSRLNLDARAFTEWSADNAILFLEEDQQQRRPKFSFGSTIA